MLYEYLQRVEDNRRGQGRQYGFDGMADVREIQILTLFATDSQF